MSNIKTIRVIKHTLGLSPGDTLTRETSNDAFVNTNFVVGDNYNYTGTMVLDPSAITDEFFEVTEWFNDYTPNSIRELAEDLKEDAKKTLSSTKKLKAELILYKDLYAQSFNANDKLHQELITLDDVNRQLNKSLQDEYDTNIKITNRINTKLSEYKKELDVVSKALAITEMNGYATSGCLVSGERLEKLSESFTVFYNMIDLLEKIKA